MHFEQTFFLTLNLNSYWKYTVKEQKLKERVWKKKLSYPLRGNETLRWWDFTSRNLPSLATSWPHKFRVLLSQQREVGVRDKVKGLFWKSRSSSRALRSVKLESFTIVSNFFTKIHKISTPPPVLLLFPFKFQTKTYFVFNIIITFIFNSLTLWISLILPVFSLHSFPYLQIRSSLLESFATLTVTHRLKN